MRHVLLPVTGALLMTGLFVAQLIENTTAPYTWMPWIILAWLVALGAGTFWLAVNRPEILGKAGAVLGSEDPAKLGG